jgi:hypothetical protein
MHPKALEEELNALKEVNEHVVTRTNILCRLNNIGITKADRRKTDERTTSRTPIPAETTFAKGNTCTTLGASVIANHFIIRTMPTPWPRVAEIVYRTSTDGPIHFIKLLSPFLNLSNALASR